MTPPLDAWPPTRPPFRPTRGGRIWMPTGLASAGLIALGFILFLTGSRGWLSASALLLGAALNGLCMIIGPLRFRRRPYALLSDGSTRCARCFIAVESGADVCPRCALSLRGADAIVQGSPLFWPTAAFFTPVVGVVVIVIAFLGVRILW